MQASGLNPVLPPPVRPWASEPQFPCQAMVEGRGWSREGGIPYRNSLCAGWRLLREGDCSSRSMGVTLFHRSFIHSGHASCTVVLYSQRASEVASFSGGPPWENKTQERMSC